jgi:hypothetical protein
LLGTGPVRARFRGRKAQNGTVKISIAKVLRLRATIAVSRDKCVKRFAQDDDFVEFEEKADLRSG